MLKPKKIKIDFFYVDMGTTDTNPLTHYMRIIANQDRLQRMWKWYDDYFRIDNVLIKQDPSSGKYRVSGEFLRIKPGVAARIIHLQKDGVHDMELPPDAYVGGGLPFMYFEECEVLVMQRSRTMANHWRFAEYVRNTSKCEYLVLEPVMKGNRQLTSFKKIYRFEFCSEAPRNMKLVDIGPHDALDTMNAYNGHSINISISANRGKVRVPLDKDLVISTIERAGLLGMRPRKSKVTGYISETLENEVLDMLRDTLEYEDTVTFSGQEPLPSEVAPALEKAYARYAEVLKRRMPPNK